MTDLEEIKKRIEENRISPAFLARQSDLSIVTLKNILSGKNRNPRLDTLQAIERILDRYEHNRRLRKP